MRFLKSFYLPLLIGAAAMLNAPAQAEPPVVVEFYTSQSCSSCPPADAVLEKLSGDPALITLGCHVTYWDHLNWKDTLSLDVCTNRQRDFGRALDRGRVYTPEAIVNGRSGMVGHDEIAIRKAISEQRSSSDTLALTVAKTDAGYAVIFPSLPAANRKPYTVTLIAYGASRTVRIGSGENGGETVTYAKPVVAIAPLKSWQGGPEIKTIPVSDIPGGTRGFVVLAQPAPGAPIAAAGEYKFINP